MRKLLPITLVIISLLQTSFGQITITSVADEKEKAAEPYDSLTNFLGNDYKKYVGQEFYLIPKDEILQEYGYEGFLNDYKSSHLDKKNTFKCCDGYNSKYAALVGKYFIVEDAIYDEKASYSYYSFLKLKMKGTGETVFYKYSTKFKHNFPFLVVGYYEKQKQLFIGNEVLYRPFPKIKSEGLLKQKKVIDIDTGAEIDFEKGKYLKCLDVTINQKYLELSLMLQNDKGQKFLVDLDSRYLDIQRILTKEEAEDYRKRFGEKNWNAVLDEKVLIGFTEEMTKVSWGEPDRINRASYGDQWVYGSTYLYFEKGKVKSFN